MFNNFSSTTMGDGEIKLEKEEPTSAPLEHTDEDRIAGATEEETKLFETKHSSLTHQERVLYRLSREYQPGLSGTSGIINDQIVFNGARRYLEDVLKPMGKASG